MPFAVTTPGGHVVRLEDVPLEVLHRIAGECGVDTWAKFLTEPIRNGAAAEKLYRHCCEVSGDSPVEPVTPKVVVEAFEWVEDDDLPNSFEGGIPKAEDDQTTSGSPGVPSDSGGPPTSPDVSPFETSNS